MNRAKDRWILGFTLSIVGVLIIQRLASELGGMCANLLAYEGVDPYNLFGWISVHHIVQMLIALLLILYMHKRWALDFKFRVGNRAKGIRFVSIFTGILVIYILVSYSIGHFIGTIQPYEFPLTVKNILGTLGFQALLSGPSEEILFRALPMGILGAILAKGDRRDSYYVYLVIVIAALLFSIAHIGFSINPLSISFDSFQLVYAFILGVVYGVTYEKCDSIIYPMIMHSMSNVLMVGIGYIFYWIYL